MDDMNAFERQLAARLEHKAGPPRPIDAMPIARSALSTAQAGRWSGVTRRFRQSTPSAPVETWFSMPSAVKLVAAAAIVALFGGFLLSGILTTPQTDDPVPALATASPSATPWVPLPREPYLGTEGFPSGVLVCPPQMVGENDDEPVGWMRSWSSGEPGGAYLGGNVVDCTAEMSDPRLTGDADIDLYWRCDEGFSDCVYWADQQIDGPDGSWVGGFTAVHDPTSPREMPASTDVPLPKLAGVVTLEGTGAYEALTFVGHFTTDMYEDTRLNGVVYEGPPPPISGVERVLFKDVEYLDLPDELALDDAAIDFPIRDEREPGDDAASGVLICPQLVPETDWELGWVRSWESTRPHSTEGSGGNPVDCTAMMDDPRLTGDADIDFYWQCGDDSACVVWGTQRIDGPDGSWTGTLTGAEDYGLPWPWPSWPYGEIETAAHMIGGVIVLEGSDDYEGLTFVGHLVTDMVEDSTLNGIVYEGQPPPIPGVRLNPTFENIEVGRE